MKLVTFTGPNGPTLGALDSTGTTILDLAVASKHRLPNTMRDFLEQGDAALTLARTLLIREDLAVASYALSNTQLLAPILNPTKIIAIGHNYAAHISEQNRQPPDHPIIFAKYPSAIIGPGETITWSNRLTQQVDSEAELAVIIGKTARNISEVNALNFVAGYTIANDVSARDLQFADKQFTRAKSLDTFCPLGPWLLTADAIPNPQALAIKAIWNDTVMQNANTADMIFGVAHLISFASRAFTLHPGDVILTGTPGGVGVFRNPPVFMQNGDQITIEIEAIGQLTNPCRMLTD